MLLQLKLQQYTINEADNPTTLIYNYYYLPATTTILLYRSSFALINVKQRGTLEGIRHPVLLRGVSKKPVRVTSFAPPLSVA